MHAPCLQLRCPLRWTSLRGDGAERHCGTCNRTVHDLSALGPERAAALVARAATEALCVRFVRSATGTILFGGLAAGLAGSPALADEPTAYGHAAPVAGEGPLPAPLAEGESVMGSLDRSVIAAPFRGLGPTLAQAWSESAAYAAGRSGRITVALRILPDGRVDGVEVRTSQLDDPAFESAVLDAVRPLTFRPTRGGTVSVVYPFEFAAEPAPSAPAP